MAYGEGSYGEASYGESVAQQFDEVAHHLKIALAAYRAGDLSWKAHVQHLAASAARLERSAGRPRLPKGASMAERQAAYVDAHGSTAAAVHFKVKEATVEKH